MHDMYNMHGVHGVCVVCVCVRFVVCHVRFVSVMCCVMLNVMCVVWGFVRVVWCCMCERDRECVHSVV